MRYPGLMAMLALLVVAMDAWGAPLDELARDARYCRELGDKLAQKGTVVERVPSVEDQRVYSVKVGGKRLLVALVLRKKRKACTVFPMVRARARAWGRFWPEVKEATKVFALGHDHETSLTTYLVVMRTKAGTLLFAFIPPRCSCALDLQALDLFKGQHTVQIYCGNFMDAADYESYVTLLHVLDGKPRNVLEVALGAVYGDLGEKNGKPCVLGPPGWVRIRWRGPRPRLQVAELVKEGEDAHHDVTLKVMEMPFSPKRQRFVHVRSRKWRVARKERCGPWMVRKR